MKDGGGTTARDANACVIGSRGDHGRTDKDSLSQLHEMHDTNRLMAQREKASTHTSRASPRSSPRRTCNACINVPCLASLDPGDHVFPLLPRGVLPGRQHHVGLLSHGAGCCEGVVEVGEVAECMNMMILGSRVGAFLSCLTHSPGRCGASRTRPSPRQGSF